MPAAEHSNGPACNNKAACPTKQSRTDGNMYWGAPMYLILKCVHRVELTHDLGYINLWEYRMVTSDTVQAFSIQSNIAGTAGMSMSG